MGDRALETRVNPYRSWTQLVSITTFKEGGGKGLEQSPVGLTDPLLAYSAV